MANQRPYWAANDTRMCSPKRLRRVWPEGPLNVQKHELIYRVRRFKGNTKSPATISIPHRNKESYLQPPQVQWWPIPLYTSQSLAPFDFAIWSTLAEERRKHRARVSGHRAMVGRMAIPKGGVFLQWTNLKVVQHGTISAVSVWFARDTFQFIRCCIYLILCLMTASLRCVFLWLDRSFSLWLWWWIGL